MTQAEFAACLDVSPVLITKLETGKKEVSKKFLIKLAKKLDVHPSSITPFLFISENFSNEQSLSAMEKRFIQLGEKFQLYLIRDRAKKLNIDVE